MNKILLLLIVSFLCITQGSIAFSESETLNNSSAPTTITAEHGINPIPIEPQLQNPALLLRNKTVMSGEYLTLTDLYDKVEDEYGHIIPVENLTDVYINDERLDPKDVKELNTQMLGTYTVQISYGYFPSKYFSNTVTVTITPKIDKTNIVLKDVTLFVGEKWDPKKAFVEAYSDDGTPLSWERVLESYDGKVYINDSSFDTVDTSKPREYRMQVMMKASNFFKKSNEVKISVKAYQPTLKTKDSTIYVGTEWDPKDNFVSATDEFGKSVPWGDSRLTTTIKKLDTSAPLVQHIQYTFKGKFETVKDVVTITVKEDQTKAKLKDDELYVGEKWELGSVFKNVVDKNGNPIKPEKVERVWIDGQENVREVDTSKPGKHTVMIAIKNAQGEWLYSNKVTLTVKEDQAKAKLKDDELYVGEKWELGRVFENVVDKDGKPIKPEEVKWVWIDGQENVREIDTSKPGKYRLYIAILNAKNKWIYSNAVIVTVKEESFTIKKVPNFDFEDNILVSTNKSVVNKKENPVIELETPSIVEKDWQLQVELSPFLDKKNKKNILKGVSLFIPKGKLESDLETEEPIQYDCQLEANGKASILMHGTKTKGKGRWRNKLETKGIALSVPSENKTGNYESTLHWTLLDVPG
ncbi:bacterial Ig-like domain-containing protein [Enterococcus faecalis]